MGKQKASCCATWGTVETDSPLSWFSCRELNIRKELIEAEAHDEKIRVWRWARNPSGAERDELKSNMAPFLQLVHVLCRRQDSQQNRCCSSERDVPRTQVDYFFTNCNNSDCMSSDGRARLAETCELPDESPGLNLGGKQGDAIRAPSTDLRVARLWYENAVPVELMTVSSISDYGSGCTMKRPSDKGTESLPLSIVSKRVELCIRKRFVTRNNNGRAETKEHILEKAPMHS